MSSNTGSSVGVNQDRIKSFKNKGKGDTEELRRRRNEVNVELRKKTKDHSINKRRNVCLNAVNSNKKAANDKTSNVKSISLSFEEIKQGILSDNDPTRQFEATQAARILLSKEEEDLALIDNIIDLEILPRCVEFLKRRNKYPDLQFEVIWLLTNIASGTPDQTKRVVDAGAVPVLISLLSSPYDNICEQAVWALGNIIGDSATMRDLAVHHGVIEPLLGFVLFKDQPQQFMRNITWVILNICKHKDPAPSHKVVKEIVPALFQLMHKSDLQVVMDAVWAVAYITDRANEKLQLVINGEIVPRLIELLASKSLTIVRPALRAIGNIVRGTDHQTDAVIEEGALPCLAQLLTCPNTNVVKEAAWAVSNITAGTTKQIQKVVDAHILGPLVNVLRTNGSFKAQKEAIWALTNITSSGTNSQVGSVYLAGCLKPMCDMLSLKTTDPVLLTVVLDGIMNILLVANEEDEVEKVALAVEECGGLDKIEDLQRHENNQVYKKAVEIIECFFGGDGDDHHEADKTDQKEAVSSSDIKLKIDGDAEMAIAF